MIKWMYSKQADRIFYSLATVLFLILTFIYGSLFYQQVFITGLNSVWDILYFLLDTMDFLIVYVPLVVILIKKVIFC